MKSNLLLLKLAFCLLSVTGYGQNAFFNTTSLDHLLVARGSMLVKGNETVPSELIKNLWIVYMDALQVSSNEFTFFLPSNTAFEQFGNLKRLQRREPRNEKEMERLFRYHVVPGKITASDMLRALCRGQGHASYTTTHGEKLYLTIEGIDIVITDAKGFRCKVVLADQTFKNSVTHEINRVMRPTDIELPLLNEE